MVHNMNSFPLRFLCIGVDSNFIAYLFASTSGFNISIDNCRTASDGLKKITSIFYDAYLLDLSALEAESEKLATEIRQKSGPQSMIVAISGSDENQLSLRLEGQGLCDQVLLKPIRPQQIDRLLLAISRNHSNGQEAPRFKTTRLEEIKKQYESAIPDKILELEQLVKTLIKEPDEVHLKALRDAVHKMAGSAGSYGFSKVSDICKEMDSKLRGKIEDKAILDLKDDPEWLSSLPEFVDSVRYYFYSPTKKNHHVSSLPIVTKPGSVFVVDENKEFLELLKNVQDQFLMTVIVESCPEKALDQLKDISFYPGAVVCSRKFSGSSLKGVDFLGVIKDKIQVSPILFGLIMEEDSIDHRIEAAQMGVDFIFHEPISAYGFLKAINEALEIAARRNFKVLVLDDDPDFCVYVNAILSEIGIGVRTINTADQLFPALADFRPQLLLLDLILPKYDGLKLLQVLRQDPAFNQLVIVVITSAHEEDIKFKAYAAKADDILFKPFEPAIFQERILGLFERAAFNSKTSAIEERTGLPNLGLMIGALQRSLLNCESVNSCFALFQVNEFAEIVSRKGPTFAKDLLVKIANQIQFEKDITMNCFAYNTSKFGIIFEHVSVASVELKMDKILSSLTSQEMFKGVQFNCSILPITEASANVQEILKQAEEGIKEASHIENRDVKILTLLPPASPLSRKSIVLVDPDKELLHTLKVAFETRGVSVETYTEGGEALKGIFSAQSHHLPSLIIAERKLPDMDGFDLFKKVTASALRPIPFYFLTLFSSDKDVSDGLNLGVADYICKPFNLSILIQKALKVIYEN